jgi:hypothetical protein
VKPTCAVNGSWGGWSACPAAQCGQTITNTCTGCSCGGTCPGGGANCANATQTCPTTDVGVPGVPTCSNLGTIYTNQAIYSWTPANPNTYTDAYNWWANGNGGSVNVPATTTTQTVPAGGSTYAVRAENNTCAPALYSGWTTCSVCYESVVCDLAHRCGQVRNCGVNCGSEDVVTPGQVSLVSPIGTVANPTIVVSPVTLTWNNNENNHSATTGYEYRVYNVTTSSWVIGNGATGVAAGGPNATSIGVTGASGSTYYWQARAVNNTCLAYAPTLNGAWSTAGYFKINSPPQFVSLRIRNASDVLVPVEAGNQNHICQSTFYNLMVMLTTLV